MNWANDIFSELFVVAAVGLTVFVIGGLLKLGCWLHDRAERRAAEQRWLDEQLRIVGWLLERQRQRQSVGVGEPKDSIGE